jgi:hypothetical protein
VTQVVECLPNKCKALSSIPSTTTPNQTISTLKKKTIRKWPETVKTHFSEDDILSASKQVKRYVQRLCPFWK